MSREVKLLAEAVVDGGFSKDEVKEHAEENIQSWNVNVDAWELIDTMQE